MDSSLVSTDTCAGGGFIQADCYAKLVLGNASASPCLPQATPKYGNRLLFSHSANIVGSSLPFPTKFVEFRTGHGRPALLDKKPPKGHGRRTELRAVNSARLEARHSCSPQIDEVQGMNLNDVPYDSPRRAKPAAVPGVPQKFGAVLSGGVYIAGQTLEEGCSRWDTCENLGHPFGEIPCYVCWFGEVEHKKRAASQ